MRAAVSACRAVPPLAAAASPLRPLAHPGTVQLDHPLSTCRQTCAFCFRHCSATCSSSASASFWHTREPLCGMVQGALLRRWHPAPMATAAWRGQLAWLMLSVIRSLQAPACVMLCSRPAPARCLPPCPNRCLPPCPNHAPCHLACLQMDAGAGAGRVPPVAVGQQPWLHQRWCAALQALRSRAPPCPDASSCWRRGRQSMQQLSLQCKQGILALDTLRVEWQASSRVHALHPIPWTVVHCRRDRVGRAQLAVPRAGHVSGG